MSKTATSTYASRSASAVRERRIIRAYLRAATLLNANVDLSAEDVATLGDQLFAADALLRTIDGYEVSDVEA